MGTFDGRKWPEGELGLSGGTEPRVCGNSFGFLALIVFRSFLLRFLDTDDCGVVCAGDGRTLCLLGGAAVQFEPSTLV